LGTGSLWATHQAICDVKTFAVLNALGLSAAGSIFLCNAIQGVLEGKTATHIQALRQKLFGGESIRELQAIVNSIPEAAQGAQKLNVFMADGPGSVHRLVNTLSGAEINAVQALINVISEKDDIQGVLKNLVSLSDVPTVSCSVFSSIYLDGMDIQRFVGEKTVQFLFNQSNVHNEVLVSSISEELFNYGDPAINRGEPRLEFHIGGRVLYFLIEQREGSAEQFTLWGRDQTARDNTPWAESKSIYLEEATPASSVAASLTDYSVVDWQLYDLVLPVGYEVEGTPIEIVSEIASELGGVLRAQDDGSLLARPKFPVRPCDLDTAVPEIDFRPDLVVDFEHSKTVGDQYNRVTIQSQSVDGLLPMIEVEQIEGTRDRIMGDTSYIRLYWEGTPGTPDIESTYTTDGTITKITGPLADGAHAEDYTETIEFENGVAETQYPIKNLKEVAWIGDTGTIEEWLPYEKSIRLDDPDAFRVATVTYDTEFHRYRLEGHNVLKLMAAFFFDSFPTVNVSVVTSQVAKNADGELIDKEGETIETAILDETGAILKGEAWIDANKHDSLRHVFKTPYQEAIKDGVVCWLDCDRVGIPGNYLIESVAIVLSGALKYNTVEAVRWQV
jgi:hypothetical protein